MYQIYFEDYPLHDPRSAKLQLRDPDVHLAVGEAGSIAFTIDPDHPHADRLTRLKGVLKLTADGRPIFKGRIRKDTTDMYLGRRIEAEGLLACLNDSIIPPFDFPGDFEQDAAYQTAAESGNVVQFFLEWLLTEHNSQVGPDQQIQLGTVTVSDPNNYISRASSEYLTAMDVVKKKLSDLMGGYLLVDYSGSTTVLHYYDDLPLTNIQTVEFSKNLIDLEVEIEAADTYTAILPIGKDGLTIAELDDTTIGPGLIKQGTIIYSEEAEAATGGRITRVVTWDDVTLASNLQTKAAAELTTNGVKLVQSIKIKAADLAGETVNTGPTNSAIAGVAVAGVAVVGVDTLPNAGSSMPRFTVGRYVQFTSRPHGFAAAYPLMELEPDILNPGNTQITLGATVKTSADLANKNQLDREEDRDQQKIELDKQKEDLELLAETTRAQITAAIQTAEQIIFSALTEYAKTTDLEGFRETMEAQFAIMADEVALRFTETTEHIINVDGDLQKTVEVLEKHFDFSLENGLVIKAGENDMSLTLDNGLIVFKKNGQQFGWWDGVDFHTGNIVIDVSERAQLGNFAFVPRSNGSLSFLKVGG